MLGDEDAFRRSIDQAIAYAQATDCRRVHVLIGNGPPDAVAVRRLREAARRFSGHGVALMLEALNPLDQPGYALPDLAAADALRIAIGEANVRLQLDAYHLLRSGGDPLAAFDRLGGHVGHIQIADPSDRGEPSEPVLFDVLDTVAASGWDGFVGAEYNPRGKTAAGLGWARRYGVVPGNGPMADVRHCITIADLRAMARRRLPESPSCRWRRGAATDRGPSATSRHSGASR
ncbi:TIM barrel protein [Rhizorhabdus histidinilytica]